jgi:hypothetical protein
VCGQVCRPYILICNRKNNVIQLILTLVTNLNGFKPVLTQTQYKHSRNLHIDSQKHYEQPATENKAAAAAANREESIDTKFRDRRSHQRKLYTLYNNIG